MNEELTLDELEVLNEAMSTWVDKDSVGNFMGDIVGAMVMRPEHPGYADYKAERDMERAEAERARKARMERSILIRAKLIHMMDAKRADALITAS